MKPETKSHPPFSVHCGNCGWGKAYQSFAVMKRSVARHKQGNEACRKDSSIQVWNAEGNLVLET